MFGQKKQLCANIGLGDCAKRVMLVNSYTNMILKKMPECWFFAKYGECSNPECIFLHIKPEDKIKPCPWYNRGFCKHGASCRFKHIRKVACPDYLGGFCFKGPNCKFAHPKFDTPKDDEPKKKRARLNGGQQAIPTMGEEEDGGFAFSRPGMEFGNRAGPEFTRKPKNLNNVECFKCKEFGHYANQCPNKSNEGGYNRDYGDRGGSDRGYGNGSY
ncbi:cleavage and polyadenylation specificity factor subunit 4 [Acrasis kona]|uniref:Cleavage and polyadenylation specificity factor subunit 4 n=1 Tax=Acrasis kona TaxID=1008807 RepID=A0AAW2ZDR9_9EUKA